MNKKIIIILSLSSILLLLTISNLEKLKIEKIEKIRYSNNKITISTEKGEILIFTNKILKLKQGDIIKFSSQIQNNQTIANKIILLNPLKNS